MMSAEIFVISYKYFASFIVYWESFLDIIISKVFSIKYKFTNIVIRDMRFVG